MSAGWQVVFTCHANNNNNTVWGVSCKVSRVAGRRYFCFANWELHGRYSLSLGARLALHEGLLCCNQLGGNNAELDAATDGSVKLLDKQLVPPQHHHQQLDTYILTCSCDYWTLLKLEDVVIFFIFKNKGSMQIKKCHKYQPSGAWNTSSPA